MKVDICHSYSMLNNQMVRTVVLSVSDRQTCFEALQVAVNSEGSPFNPCFGDVWGIVREICETTWTLRCKVLFSQIRWFSGVPNNLMHQALPGVLKHVRGTCLELQAEVTTLAIVLSLNSMHGVLKVTDLCRSMG